jgi:cation diffusion facilitator CzcD-associated flavoprotein CzcO
MFDDGVTAYLGMTTPNFPNFFVLGGPYSLQAHNSGIVALEFQVSEHQVEGLSIPDV